jgi:hypothetical protein
MFGTTRYVYKKVRSMVRSTICFTICLFISPDLDDMFRNVCFTICLFISPDLDGNRATSTKKNVPRETHDMFHDMFVH